MSWVKEANKIGEYRNTYQGFRIYRTQIKEGRQYTEQREDGLYLITDFGSCVLVAVDKTGMKFEDTNIEQLAFKIEIENAQRYFDKRGW